MSDEKRPFGFGAIEGQDSAIGVLEQALERDRIAHAYLFDGPSGVGKERAARTLAAALLCPSARRDRTCVCAACQRIQAGIHPDLRIFRPRDEGDRNLQVEVVRTEILPFVRFAPFEASAACVIFPQADVSFPDQHEESANALLKTLEEPRERITFILLSERPDRLLTTVRSRCQRVRFRPLSAAVLDRILERHGVEPALRPAAIALAQGSADRALAFASDERAQRLLELVLRIDRAVTASKPGDLLDLAAELAQSEQLELELSTLALFYRDVAHVALRDDPERLSFPEQRALLAERAERLGARGAAERVAAIAETSDALDRNANPETALDAMLFGFAH
ncbi:MAG TPA: AAA family ATPase [Polyangiales bacterium]